MLQGIRFTVALKSTWSSLGGILIASLGIASSGAPVPAVGTAQSVSFRSTGNPVFEAADPDVLFHAGQFWVYPTGGGPDDRAAFYAFSSPDLKTWTRQGPILSFQSVQWIRDDGAPRRFAWAPGILHRDGRFYLYFSAGPNTPKPSRIGVAVAGNPQGPFVDIGRSLLVGSNGFEAIDAKAFEEPGSGRTLLYCGGSAGSKLRVFELGRDLTSIAREIPVQNPPRFTEGAFIHHRNRVFYLSYSHGNFRDASYSVHYCTSDSATGPWTYQGEILSTDAVHQGPGHHAIIQRPDTGEWLIFYHRWNGASRAGKLPARRSVCIETLQYDADGKILPVRMTEGLAPAHRP
ncbi:MAG: glycosyl hydrolase 43 family protein [Verrucomicrobia bacterium]|nr:glycosyl hydrolase 43 family protein [Verrucomicrobiota bacterium]